jgi:hypothetical protein
VILNMYFISFGFDDSPPYVWMITTWMEVIFFIEIVLHFLTSFKDLETFKNVVSVRQIAINYILTGTFLTDVLPVIPYEIFFPFDEDDFHQQALRNVLIIKLVRVVRIGT